MPNLVILVIVCLACLGLQGSFAAPEVYRVGSKKQVFLDGALIASSAGVTLSLNPPRKTGERCIVAERPWEGHRVCAYNTVVEDGGIYKMWYDAIANDKSRWLCYATSRDGIHWEKPSLGLVAFQDSKDNNIVFPHTPSSRHEPGCVFIDRNPRCPPDKRYKMVCSYDGPGGSGTYVGASPDGLRWTLLTDKPSFRWSDTNNRAFWDERIARYVGFVRVWAPMRKVGRCEFDDLTDWGREKIVLSYDGHDPPNVDLYTNGTVEYPWADNAYLMFPSAYYHFPAPPAGPRRNDGTLDVRLAVSRDGIRWSRPDRRPFVALGVEGGWDDGALYMGTGMIRRGAELWMYYAGFDFTHGNYNMRRDRFKGAISRLVLRLDGFLSLDAAYEGGTCTTVPVVFEGTRLDLNVQTSVAGSLQVEILDGNGRAVPGFTLEQSDPIRGNFIARTVTWKGREDVSALAGTPVRLRFAMRDAKLYAFHFTTAQ